MSDTLEQVSVTVDEYQRELDKMQNCQLSVAVGEPVNPVIYNHLARVVTMRRDTLQESIKMLHSRFGYEWDLEYKRLMKQPPQ